MVVKFRLQRAGVYKPICQLAMLLCTLAKSCSLDDCDLRTIRDIGFIVEITNTSSEAANDN